MAQEEELYEQGGYEDEIPMGEADDGGGHQTTEDLESLKQQLKQMEEEAARLKAMQAGGSGEAGTAAAGAAGAARTASNAAEIADKEEADARSIYVGSVDYACTPEELQQHFQGCGTVNRVTILTDQFGQPKGYAYVEFLEVEAVTNALLLDSTELRGRMIKVVQKRTNVPGLKRGRGRGRGGGRGFGGRGGFDPYGGGYGYGYTPPPYGGRGRGFYGAPGGFVPRGRGRGRFSPY